MDGEVCFGQVQRRFAEQRLLAAPAASVIAQFGCRYPVERIAVRAGDKQ
jgi:hypothetical protein